MALRYPTHPLTDGAVVLRPWQASDLPVLERASADEYVALIEHIPVPFTEAGGHGWITRKHAQLEARRGCAFAIASIATGDAVGGAGITFRHSPGVAEAGGWVIAEKRNLGIAERAAGLLCRWALTDDTGVARLEATVELWNIASQRVLEKAGFVREGRLRSYSSWRDGRQDVFIYSLLPDDLVNKESGEIPASARRELSIFTES